jgi:hypothetical protein
MWLRAARRQVPGAVIVASARLNSPAAYADNRARIINEPLRGLLGRFP